MAAEPFYPFVNPSDENDGELPQPTSPARIAVYDDMSIAPRVITIEATDIRSYLEQITATVYDLASKQGGDWPFSLIRELVENYIHAYFEEPTVSILDKGQTLTFSDQGPGIPDKEAALRPSFSSATKAMKHYIRGVGSGLPVVEEQIKLRHGTISIDDNIGRGTIVTVSLKQDGTPQKPVAAPDIQPGQTGGFAAYGAPAAAAGMAYQQQPAYQQPQYPQPGYIGAAQFSAQQSGYMPAVAPTYNPSQSGYMPAVAPAYNPSQTGAWQQGQAVPGYQPYPQAQPAPWPQSYAPAQGYPAAAAQYPQQAAAPYGTYPVQQPNAAYGQYPAQGAPTPPNGGYGYAQPQPSPWTGAPDVTATGMAPLHAQLNPEQEAILSLFASNTEIGPSELVAHGIVSSLSTATRRLQGLEETGMVMKVGKKYELTGEGRCRLDALHAMWKDGSR